MIHHNRNWNRNLCSLFLAILSLTFLACGQERTPTGSPTEKPTPTVTTPPGDTHRAIFGLAGGPNSYQTTSAAWAQLLQATKEAGGRFIHIQPMGWGESEATPGTFNFSDFDALLPLLASFGIGYTLDIGTPMGIERIDLPPDMVFSSFQNATMVTRYKRYVAAILEKFPAPTHVVLHTETATHFLKDNPAEFNAYCQLLSQTADYVRSLAPSAKVGIYTTINDTPEELAKMGANTDYFSLGYNADRGNHDHRDLITKLHAVAGDKKIGIHEIGTPTASRVGGSESAQVDFVNLIFDLAVEWKDQLEFLAYYQGFDEDPAITSVWLPAMFPDWTPEMQQDGIAWFGSLGLNKYDGTPKPAWETFKKRIREFPQ